MKTAKLAGFLLVIAAILPAQAAHRGNGAPPIPSACPFGVDGGCAGANPNSSFINPGFLTSAIQSSQSSILPGHPQPNNMAGVDYRVGYDTTLTLKDPTTNPPSGFTYVGPGSGGPKITSAGFGDLTVTGYDLLNPSGVGPVAIVVGSNQTSGHVTTISHNKMGNSATHNGGISVGGFASLVVKFNEFDDLGLGGSGGFFVFDSRSGAGTDIDIEYNAFLNISAPRIYGGPRGGGSRIFKNNYLYGLDALNQADSEVDLYGGGTGQFTPIPLVDWSYNTIAIPTQIPTFAINAVFLWGTGAMSGTSVTTLNEIGNTVVINKIGVGGSSGGGQAAAGSGLLAGGWASLGTVTLKDNYFDPTGSLFCSNNGSASQSTTASANGNILTITAITGLSSNNWEAGQAINGTGFTTAHVLAFGTTDPNTGLPSTGTGLTGTYVFDGPPQTVASNSSWLITPAFAGTPTISGNINLTDGSALAFAGPQLHAPACNNHA